MVEKISRNVRVDEFKLNKLAEFIREELSRRQKARQHQEYQWMDIARQKAMKPRPSNIDVATGRAAEGSEWMPFLEMPWQMQTLEMSVADCMRLLFPADQDYFNVFCDPDEKQYAAVMESAAKEEGFLVGEVNAEDISEIIQALHLQNQKSYRFRDQMSLICADGISYGTGVARGRPGLIATNTLNYTGNRYRDGDVIPMLTQMSIWTTYLDDRPSAAERSDYVIGPAPIYTFNVYYPSLVHASKNGSSDPSDIDGGWVKGALDDVEPKDNAQVTLVEWDGDIALETKDNDWLFLDNALITCVQANGKNGPVDRVVRIRYFEKDHHCTLTAPYFLDTKHERRVNDFSDDFYGSWNSATRAPNSQDPDFASAMGVYGVGPLLFGRNLQKGGSEAFNRSLQAGILNLEPPLLVDRADPFFRSVDFKIKPREIWKAIGDVRPIEIGDLAALGGQFSIMKNEYESVTSTSGPRLGQQTKSHQTEDAIQMEIQRGSVRVVDYVNDLKTGFMPAWLQKEYAMMRHYIPSRGVRVYLPKQKQYFTVKKEMLPELVEYEVFGAAEPIEQAARERKIVNKITLLANLEQSAVQAGADPIDWNEIRRAILEERDIDIAKVLPESSGVGPGVQQISGPIAPGPEDQGAGGTVTPLNDLQMAAGTGR